MVNAPIVDNLTVNAGDSLFISKRAKGTIVVVSSHSKVERIMSAAIASGKTGRRPTLILTREVALPEERVIVH